VSVDSAVAHFRRRQESLFRSTCDITRAGTPVFDPATGTYTSPSSSVASDVACLIRAESASERQAGETQVTLNRFVGKLPANTEVETGDILTVTASRHDDGLVGRVMTVVDVQHDDLQITRRVILEENRG
jgi:hypothetical protein